MSTTRRIFSTIALCLAVGVCVSCTQFCFRFIDMGQVSTGVEIPEPKEVYRVGNRLYVQGVKAEFEYRHDWLWKELKKMAVNIRVSPARKSAACITK